MKLFSKKFILIVLTLSSFCSYGQQLMQSTKDISVICQNDDKFVGKPLSVLLNEIKPTIKMVFVEGGWREKAPRISFFFMTREEYQKCVNHKISPTRLTVFLKDTFTWTMEERTREHYWEWTSHDKEKLGSNIVTLLRVSGDCDSCETNVLSSN